MPPVSADVVRAAEPADTVTMLKVVMPSLNVMLPVALVGDTVAVNVTG